MKGLTKRLDEGGRREHARGRAVPGGRVNRRDYWKTDCWLALMYGDRVPDVRQEYHGRFPINGELFDRKKARRVGFTIVELCRVGTRPRRRRPA